MSITYSFSGTYRFESASAIGDALAELREVLDDEDEVPDPFDAGHIVIDGTEVRFAISGGPSAWFDYYDTIVEAFADHATGGEVTVRCEDETEVYEAGPRG